MRYDLHTHTLFSDGRNKVWDVVKAAEANGLEAVAITDHLQPDRWGNIHEEWIEAMLREVEAVRGKVKVRVLAGVEATLLSLQGEATVTPEIYRRVDLVLCGIEWATPGISLMPPEDPVSFQRNLVTAYCNLALNPWVDIIAHPFNLGRFPSRFPLRKLATSAIREIAAAFKEGEKAFELNNTLWWWFPEETVEGVLRQYAGIVEEFAVVGVKFVFGSDAHSLDGVGNLHWALRLAETVGLSSSYLLTLEDLRRQRLRRFL